MWTENKRIPSIFLTVLLLLSPLVSLAASRLDVQVTPKSTALKKNIEAYINQLAEGDAKSLNAVKRTVQQQTRLASEALGYYQTQVVVRVTDDEEPILQVLVERGDPVRLRTVIIKVEGEAADLPAFAIPDDKRLEVGARLDQAINMRVVSSIFASWLVTLPAGAILSVIIFFILKASFG